MVVSGIHHVAIKALPASFDRLVSFYRDLLGLKMVRTWGEGNNRGVMLSTGDNSLLELMSSAEDQPGEGALRHIALAVDDVDVFTDLVSSHGYPVTVKPNDLSIPSDPPYPVRIAFVTGPVGETIEFFHVY